MLRLTAAFSIALAIAIGTGSPSVSQNPQATNSPRPVPKLGIQLPNRGGMLTFGSAESPEWDTLLRQLFEEDGRTERLISQQTLTVLMALVDLNGDGYPELVTFSQGDAFCGAAGCAIKIFQRQPSGWSSIPIFEGLGMKLSVSEARGKGQYRSVTLDYGKRWEFRDSVYRIVN
jgi:hypothetical protein